MQDESGKVTGAICQNKSGEYVQYNAPRAWAVWATGDISYNDEYIEEFSRRWPTAVHLPVPDQATGDGDNMAAWLAAPSRKALGRP